MELKSQDVVVALKLCVLGSIGTYAALGKSLGISTSEVHAAVRRLVEAGLAAPDNKNVYRSKLRNFIVHGIPYVFPARPKEISRGMRTAWAAPVLANKFGPSSELPPVWPDPKGITKGIAVSLRAKSPTNLRVKITHPLRRDITPQWGDERTQSDTTTNDSCPA